MHEGFAIVPTHGVTREIGFRVFPPKAALWFKTYVVLTPSITNRWRKISRQDQVLLMRPGLEESPLFFGTVEVF